MAKTPCFESALVWNSLPNEIRKTEKFRNLKKSRGWSAPGRARDVSVLCAKLRCVLSCGVPVLLVYSWCLNFVLVCTASCLVYVLIYLFCLSVLKFLTLSDLTARTLLFFVLSGHAFQHGSQLFFCSYSGFSYSVHLLCEVGVYLFKFKISLHVVYCFRNYVIIVWMSTLLIRFCLINLFYHFDGFKSSITLLLADFCFL